MTKRLSTGFASLDQLTAGGLRPGDFIVIGGRPSVGKSALAINLVKNVAVQQNKLVASFSMEMREEQWREKLLSSISGIELNKVKGFGPDPQDREQIKTSIDLLKQKEDILFFNDTPALKPSEISTLCRKVAPRPYDMGLVLIDYLQLMHADLVSGNRTVEIAQICGALKALATELCAPVVAFSQLTRDLELRPDRRPLFSDLYESESIQEHADLIAFIYRDEIYNPGSADKGIAEISIRKHIAGDTGVVRLLFSGKTMRYDDYNNFECVPRYLH